MSQEVDINRIIAVHNKMGEHRAILRKAYEEDDKALKEQEEQLANFLLAYLLDHNLNSVRTDAGTVYRETTIMPTGSDWEAFYRWVKEHDAFDALERRIKRKFITDYMDEHNGELPPGVSVFGKTVAKIRQNS